MRRCRNCHAYSIPKGAPASQWWCSEICKAGYLQWKDDKKKKPKKSPKPKRKKQKSIAALANEAADLLQRLVRLKAANSDGYCKCASCGVMHKYNEMDGGHFIERGKLSTKLVEENVHPQCKGCNGFGMKYRPSVVLDYRRYMVGMYGEELVRELEQLSKQPKKFTRYELEELKAEFAKQIKIQEERLGI